MCVLLFLSLYKSKIYYVNHLNNYDSRMVAFTQKVELMKSVKPQGNLTNFTPLSSYFDHKWILLHRFAS